MKKSLRLLLTLSLGLWIQTKSALPVDNRSITEAKIGSSNGANALIPTLDDTIYDILYSAACAGDYITVKKILETPGVNKFLLLTRTHNEMHSPLGIAIIFSDDEKNFETIRTMLETSGINKEEVVKSKNNDGLSAPTIAIMFNHPKTLKMLLETPGLEFSYCIKKRILYWVVKTLSFLEPILKKIIPEKHACTAVLWLYGYKKPGTNK